jgi:hypothetical protein
MYLLEAQRIVHLIKKEVRGAAHTTSTGEAVDEDNSAFGFSRHFVVILGTVFRDSLPSNILTVGVMEGDISAGSTAYSTSDQEGGAPSTTSTGEAVDKDCSAFGFSRHDVMASMLNQDTLHCHATWHPGSTAHSTSDQEGCAPRTTSTGEAVDEDCSAFRFSRHDAMASMLTQNMLHCHAMMHPSCDWVKPFYTSSKNDRQSFWELVEEKDDRHSLIVHFVLRPFECITPLLMGKIYDLFCSMTKEQQKFLLSLCYQTKCWRDNAALLRGNNFLCYSPSYSQGDGECQSARNMQSSFLSSTKVERGVIFGCARCSELYGLGYSRLKHSTNFPFNHDSDNSNEEGIEQEVPVILAYLLALKMSLFAEELLSDSFHYDESSVQNDTEHVRGVDGAAHDSEQDDKDFEDSKGVHEGDSESEDGIIVYGGVEYGSNDLEQDGDTDSQDDIFGMKDINVVDDEHLLSDRNVERDPLLVMEAGPQGQKLYHRSVWGIDGLVVDDSTE